MSTDDWIKLIIALAIPLSLWFLPKSLRRSVVIGGSLLGLLIGFTIGLYVSGPPAHLTANVIKSGLAFAIFGTTGGIIGYLAGYILSCLAAQLFINPPKKTKEEDKSLWG
jgi:hypothetical protein